MKRLDFQKLAAVRMKEANVLFRAGCFEGAYYLAGYAAECAIKACIARRTERFEFPDKKRAESSNIHRLPDLVRAADLDSALREAMQQSRELRSNWQIVQESSELSRYESRSPSQAEALLNALRDRRHGFLRWLKEHW